MNHTADPTEDAVPPYGNQPTVARALGKHRALTICVLSILFVTMSCRNEGEPSLQSPEDILQSELAARKTPAVQYRFFSADSVLRRYDGGVADVAGRIPVSDETAYNAFSITKTFTALAVLRLVDEGRVELDRPAGEYIPRFPYSHNITVRQLLAHSAGLPNPIPLSWIHLPGEHAAFDRDAFFNERFSRNSKVKARPNERFGYSNLGYVLLGQLIEKVSGLTYEQYITDEILIPLGVRPAEIGFDLTESARAKGYHKKNSFSFLALGFFLDKSKYIAGNEQGWMAFRPYEVNGTAYGGLRGTADGFVRYVQGLLTSPSPLTSEASKRELFTENLLNDGKPSGMTLSWHRGDLNGHVYYAHAGGGGGFYAEIRIYPGLNRGSVIMFNRSGISDERFLDRVDRYAIQAGSEDHHES